MIAPNDLRNIGLRKGDWMYISAQGGGGFNAEHRGMHDFGGAAATIFTKEENSDIENGKIKADAPPAQLYNVEEDRSEYKNLYNKYPEKVEAMKKEIEEIRNSKQTRPAN